MARFTRTTTILLAGVAGALSGCGASDIASPGDGVIVIPAPTPAPTPTPGPTPTPTPGTGLVTPAAKCPTIAGPNPLVDRGTISGPTGEYRNCAFPARFTTTTQIAKVPGVVYSLDGRVDVGTDQGASSTGYKVVLGIDPGVVIFGATGVSYLAVNRGNQIDAVGTETQPIIFTGRGNVVGTVNDQSSQLWGGVVLLGRAPITDCLAPGAKEGTASCERDTEGTSNALYGGAQPTDNSGKLAYVQIRYSGFVLSADKELQGLTPSGVGSATRMDHIQIHNSSDDGIETFGGRPNYKYLVLTGNEDDNLDTDVGYKGFIQFVIAVQRVGGAVGDAMIEADSNGNEQAVPRQFVRLANFTFIQRSTAGSDLASILIRGGADYTLVNGIVSTPASLACVRFNGAATVQAEDPSKDEAGAPTFHSVLLTGCNPAFSGTDGANTTQVQNIFNRDANNQVGYTPTLTSLFINGTNETAAKTFDPTRLNDSSNFLVKTNYVGAVSGPSDTWYQNWTCNSATANFGGSGTDCTTLPTS